MKVSKAYYVGTSGSVLRLESLEGKELSLKAMYKFIGPDCHTIEHVGLKKGVDMWVDENGLAGEDIIINKKATQIYRDAYPHIAPDALFIVGNVIITDNTKAGAFKV